MRLRRPLPPITNPKESIMSHNLSTFTDHSGTERHCMMSYRESPWHKLGQTINVPVGSSEALSLGGLDWTVAKKSLWTSDLDAVPKHVAAMRSDTHAVLGVVGNDWEPLQNREMFTFLDSLAQTSNHIIYETCGALGQGETVWVLAHLPDLTIRIGEDTSKAYMLIFNGHAGNRLLTVAPTTIRVVCQNTLRMASAQIQGNRHRPKLEAGFRIRHTKGMKAALADVADAYANTRAAHQATKDAYEFLAKVPITEGMITTVLERSFRYDLAPSEADRAKSIKEARDQKLREILASPTCQVSGTADSAFALLNAVTEYVDHLRPTRTREGQATNTQRFTSAHWGSGAQVKQAAWETIMDLLC